MMRLALAILSIAALDAFAAQPVAPKYTPTIRGQLTNGGQPLATNVCLRQSGSEIRSCGYTDFEGRFQIPGSGPLRTAPQTVEANGDHDYPIYWLEVGRVEEARKIAPIDLVDATGGTVDLACDLGRSADNERGFCRPAAAEPIAKIDSTPHRRHPHDGPGGGSK